jgi:xylulose-5-phosphate/fructose-6-phosphate phosphoketolase
VVDLMALEPPGAHPHGMPDRDFDSIFTTHCPVVFAFHGYPALVHRLTYKRANHDNFHVHGYQEEGTTTTPFDMTVLNRLDRFHLALDAIDRVPRLAIAAAPFKQYLQGKLIEHRAYVTKHGRDLPEVADWKWS